MAGATSLKQRIQAHSLGSKLGLHVHMNKCSSHLSLSLSRSLSLSLVAVTIAPGRLTAAKQAKPSWSTVVSRGFSAASSTTLSTRLKPTKCLLVSAVSDGVMDAQGAEEIAYRLRTAPFTHSQTHPPLLPPVASIRIGYVVQQRQRFVRTAARTPQLWRFHSREFAPPSFDISHFFIVMHR